MTLLTLALAVTCTLALAVTRTLALGLFALRDVKMQWTMEDLNEIENNYTFKIKRQVCVVVVHMFCLCLLSFVLVLCACLF